MATEIEDQENEQAAGEKKSKLGGPKVKLIVLIVVGLLLLAVSVGGTLSMLGFFDVDETKIVVDEVVDDKELDESAPAKKQPAMYFPINPSFVVNFQSQGRQRYLQVDVAVMTRNPEIYSGIQTHLPLIKNRLVMLFSGEVYEELQTDEGKELLRHKSLEALKTIMQEEIGLSEVDQVLFTNFVMQ